MGRLDERTREITATEELPLEPALRPRLARGTDRHVTIGHSGALKLHRRFTELRSLVIEIVEQLMTGERVRVFVFAPEPVFAWVDATLLEHVISGLLLSALDCSVAKSSIVLRLDERHGAACISITDNALVPRETRHMTTPRRDGHHMMASREIITAHGGSFSIERLRNTSTRTSIEIPLTYVPARRQRLAGCRGLLVGRALPHAEELSPMLTAEGMSLERSDTHRDAMQAIRVHRPDAVVIDADPPGAAASLPGVRAQLPNALLLVVTSTPVMRFRSREPMIVVNPIDAGELFAIITRRLAPADSMP